MYQLYIELERPKMKLQPYCKMMVWHWVPFDVSFKTFRLLLHPSSVEILTLVSLSKNESGASNARWGNSSWSFKKTYSEILTLAKDLGWRCGDFQIAQILYWHPGFKEESLVKVGLVSYNSDTFKIHFLVAFRVHDGRSRSHGWT